MERAKEAGKRERAVCKLHERFGLLEQINSDLTYAVAVNLAQAYHAAQLYSEALNSFTQIVRSKQFPQVCCLGPLFHRIITVIGYSWFHPARVEPLPASAVDVSSKDSDHQASKFSACCPAGLLAYVSVLPLHSPCTAPVLTLLPIPWVSSSIHREVLN